MDERRLNLLPNEVIENKEDIQLIWGNENLDDSDKCCITKTSLLELNSAAQFYSDLERCIDLIKALQDERIFLIISGTFAHGVLSKISTHRTVVAIFILCSNPEYYQSLVNDNEKIIGIFTNEDSLLKSIETTMNLIRRQTLAFNLFDQKQKSLRALSKDSASFLWNQMLIYVLKQIPQNQQSKDEMLKICRDYYRNNKRELKKIDEFQSNYTSDMAIEWYTEECFLYKLLNKALRTENIELLYNFRFFTIDLCAALENESHQLRDKDIFILYRGTQLPREELEKLKQNKNKVISTNGFLSTSRNIDVSLAFAGYSLPEADFQAVLFTIEADPSLKTVIFADLKNKTRMKDEEEILFNLNARFKIGSVHFDSTIQIWNVQLTATDEGSEKIQEYFTLAQQEFDECPPIIYFGRLLHNELGQIDRAEKYFQILLKTLPSDHRDIAAVYNQIGNVHHRKGALNLALRNFELAYTIHQERLPPKHPHISFSLHNIASIYKAKGNFDRALDYCQQALDV